MKIPVFGLVMIFVIWLTYELRKHTKEEVKTRKDFWERERKSGFIPRKSTSDIHYITITEQFMPDDRGPADSELYETCDRILGFKDKPVADLSAYTNTELKEKYGTANFKPLSEADNNFTFLVPMLGRVVELLYKEGRLAEAEKAALFCTENGIYTYPVVTTLGELYSLVGEKDKLNALIETVSNDPKARSVSLEYLKSLH
ncbi:MAG: hypothetical protein IK007_06745 [Lachnospiraceae bacterium]|nr:hypothetical protein [Lachnospiraceae bacterium]MBR4777295.1 hypothetical protein [Lachnospiraceae bacterium]